MPAIDQTIIWNRPEETMPDDEITVLAATEDEIISAYHADGQWKDASTDKPIFYQVTWWALLPEPPAVN